MVNRIDLTKRKDGYVISTVEPMFMAWNGKYETGIMLEGGFEWHTNLMLRNYYNNAFLLSDFQPIFVVGLSCNK